MSLRFPVINSLEYSANAGISPKRASFLPPVNLETIKDNSEFHCYLYDKHRDLYVILWSCNFDINKIPEKYRDRRPDIVKEYSQFVEKKENWFETYKTSKTNLSAPSMAQIKKWLKPRIQLLGEESKPSSFYFENSGTNYVNPRETIKEKTLEKIADVIEKFSKIFPAAVNKLMGNILGSTNFWVVVLPREDTGLQVPGMGKIKNVEAGFYSFMGRCWLLLKEDSVFTNDKSSYTTIAHEFFHALDCVMPDTSFGEYCSCRQNTVYYSDILNDRLGGELARIAEKEGEKSKRMCNELEKLTIEGSITCLDDAKKICENLKEKYKIWIPIKPVPMNVGGYSTFGFSGLGEILTVHNLFAYVLETYFYNRAELKKHNPRLCEIVEKEVFPDLT